jgi:hypothetical protein
MPRILRVFGEASARSSDGSRTPEATAVVWLWILCTCYPSPNFGAMRVGINEARLATGAVAGSPATWVLGSYGAENVRKVAGKNKVVNLVFTAAVTLL